MVELRVAGVGLLRGLVTGSGPDWVLLDHRAEHPLTVVPGPGDERRVDRPVLVATAAIRAVTGLGGAEQTGAVAKGFGLGSALRAVSRDRCRRRSRRRRGHRRDGDHRQRRPGLRRGGRALRGPAPPGTENVIAVRAVPFAGIAMVRRR